MFLDASVGKKKRTKKKKRKEKNSRNNNHNYPETLLLSILKPTNTITEVEVNVFKQTYNNNY